MGEWAATVIRRIQVLVTMAAMLFSVGMAWNLTQIIISVGMDGLPRVVPSVVLNTLGMLFGYLIVSNAFTITMAFFEAFVAPELKLS